MQPSGSNGFESRYVVFGQNATYNVCHTCKESTNRCGCCFWSCSLLHFRTIAISFQFITCRRSFVNVNRLTGVTEGSWRVGRTICQHFVRMCGLVFEEVGHIRMIFFQKLFKEKNLSFLFFKF